MSCPRPQLSKVAENNFALMPVIRRNHFNGPTFSWDILIRELQVSESQYNWDPDVISPEELLPPTFRDTPNKTIARLGETAVLRCAIDNLGTKKVTWRKNTSFAPLFIETNSFQTDVRYSIEHEPLMPDWNMIIDQVNSSDQGLYICEVSTTPTMQYFVYLKVIREYLLRLGHLSFLSLFYPIVELIKFFYSFKE
ncbi:Kin of IRRE-like protein 3 [Elysia marginata]|uniref:Kin of IRRE-like protein 3 n=1 Tax=Elysia marginata TaxID=1093978 RepID=A0AAV4FN47_9GAST|nr:Kin of IRRE-like protein 3 [Elysia marginata]